MLVLTLTVYERGAVTSPFLLLSSPSLLPWRDELSEGGFAYARSSNQNRVSFSRWDTSLPCYKRVVGALDSRSSAVRGCILEDVVKAPSALTHARALERFADGR